jgi:hypothetical protein
MKFVLFIIMFLMIISLVIINNHDLKISEKEDFHAFLGTYANWFKIFFSNVKVITGNAVNQKWLPE